MTSPTDPISKILQDFGPAVLLEWPGGTKGDERFWGHRTLDRQDNSRLRGLRAHAKAGGNIGIALGKVSQNLCAIDLDTEEDVLAF